MSTSHSGSGMAWHGIHATVYTLYIVIITHDDGSKAGSKKRKEETRPINTTIALPIMFGYLIWFCILSIHTKVHDDHDDDNVKVSCDVMYF